MRFKRRKFQLVRDNDIQLTQMHESLAELLAIADKAFNTSKKHRDDCEIKTNSGFFGRSFESWADVVQKSAEAWPEGIEMMENIISQLEHLQLPTPKSHRKRLKWSEDGGDEIDLDRLRSGTAFWRTTVREEARGQQLVSIFVNIGGSWQMAAKDLMWRGAAAIVLADILENAGYQVELYAVDSVYGAYTNGDGNLKMVRLKEAGSPVDRATLVNAVSGWFFRTVWFQARYAINPHGVNFNMGFAKNIVMEKEFAKHTNGLIVPLDGFYNESDAVNVISFYIHKLRGEEVEA